MAIKYIPTEVDETGLLQPKEAAPEGCDLQYDANTKLFFYEDGKDDSKKSKAATTEAKTAAPDAGKTVSKSGG